MSDEYFQDKKPMDLFPDVFTQAETKKSLKHEEQRILPKSIPINKSNYPRLKNPSISPPEPPDLTWLKNGLPLEKSVDNQDFQQALIISNNKERVVFYTNILRTLQIYSEHTFSEPKAIKLIHSRNFRLILYESSLEFRSFEQYIRNLSGQKRREIIYVIIGTKLTTLYNLEALSLSANLVINAKDIPHLEKILKKGFQDYDNLYRAFLDALRESGKI